MLNTNDIKNRIKSIKETHQITKAMELISISKMKKATVKYQNNLIYYNKVRQTIKDILLHSKEISHPFLQERESSKTAYVVIAGDKGLAGGYNKNVLTAAWEHMSRKEDKYIFSIGYKTRDFFASKNIDADTEFLHIIQNPELADARRIAYEIIAKFIRRKIDEVLVFSTEFVSTFVQKPIITRLLPLKLSDFEDSKLEFEYDNEINYDPSYEEVFRVLIPQYIVGQLYGLLVQSSVSEHSARMLAMSSANKNGEEILQALKIDYNRARQSSITNDIIEISRNN